MTKCYACRDSRVACSGPMSHPIIMKYCCRPWPIVLGFPMGPCGYCGRVPNMTIHERRDDDQTNL